MKQLQLSKYEKIFTPDKKKWVCKFCGLISTDFEYMVKHEDECCFNLKNKTCETCQRYYHYSVCNRLDKGESCPRWKNTLFDRREKLNKIINKL